MQVTVRAFATVRERLGTAELVVTVAPGTTLGGLVAELAARPGADRLKDWLESGHLRLARNRVHTDAQAILADGDEVALFPPVSGG